MCLNLDTLQDVQNGIFLQLLLNNRSFILGCVFQMLQIFSNQAKPNIQSFLGCMAFIKMWLGQSLDIDEMDKNDGLPPEKWIVMAKEAVKRVYSCANGQ